MCIPISFPAEFTGMLLWGIDEILTYHYLIAGISATASWTTPSFSGCLSQSRQS